MFDNDKLLKALQHLRFTTLATSKNARSPIPKPQAGGSNPLGITKKTGLTRNPFCVSPVFILNEIR